MCANGTGQGRLERGAYGELPRPEPLAQFANGRQTLANAIAPALQLAAQGVGYLVRYASFHLPRIIPQTSAQLQAHRARNTKISLNLPRKPRFRAICRPNYFLLPPYFRIHSSTEPNIGWQLEYTSSDSFQVSQSVVAPRSIMWSQPGKPL